MNPEQKILELEGKIDKIYKSVEKTRKYFFWTLVITVVFFVLPLVGLMFAVPALIGTYTEITSLGL